MSAKWHRSKAWDDRVFPAWAFPLKWTLRTLSSIWFAVLLLIGVSIYGILASIPMGMLALIPTYLIYASVFALTVGAALAIGLVSLQPFAQMTGPAGRFAMRFLGGIVFAACGVLFFVGVLWPRLDYDPGTGEGFRLFAAYAETYKSTTLRRLPGIEMTELQFYTTWPMQLMLILFVINMIVATVRRIEFKFVNIGVLSVHSGIVLMAVGSLYYGVFKMEGDTMLASGPLGENGLPEAGPWQEVFYDRERVALHIRSEVSGWYQIPLDRVPRYNNYGLNVTAGPTAWTEIGAPVDRPDDAGRTLSIDTGHPREQTIPLGVRFALAVDRLLGRETRPLPNRTPPASDLRFRVVGYTKYAEEQPRIDWLKVDPSSASAFRPGDALNPLRELRLGAPDFEPLSFFMLPRIPRWRVAEVPDIGIEYLLDPSEQRLRDLLEPLPENTWHALIAEVEDADGTILRRAIRVASDEELFVSPVPIGDSGFTIAVEDVLERPDLPIVTEGFEGAESSLLKVRVNSPEGESVTRWVYHRYPEIAQDIADEVGDDGRPARRDPDPRLRLAHVDATKPQVFVVEFTDRGVGLILRMPGGRVFSKFDETGEGRFDGVLDGLTVEIGQRWAHAEAFERPIPKAPHLQDRDFIGTHDRAMLAVEVTSEQFPEWKRLVWLPYTRYLREQSELTRRTIALPDGRRVTMAFGRQWRRLPGFELRLEDFEMIEYAHRGAPRDYQSIVSVRPPPPITFRPDEQGNRPAASFEPFTHVAKLNAPLRAPFNVYDPPGGPVIGFIGRLLSGINPGQFKFAQAGWDPNTWNRTREKADAGEIERPYVAFTILHAGNNPGIHIIAFGGILMGAGIPWAFYVKPWLLRRKKAKIQQEIASGKRPAPKKNSADQKPDGPTPGAEVTA